MIVSVIMLTCAVFALRLSLPAAMLYSVSDLVDMVIRVSGPQC